MNTSPSASWFYSEQQQQLGPISFAELQEKFAKGLPLSTLVWTQGMAEWIPASQVPEIGQTALSNPYAAPSAIDSGHSAPPVYSTYATFLPRFAAAFLDSIIIGFMSLLVGMGFGFFISITSSALSNNLGAIELIGNLIGLVIGWLYAAFLESSPKQATWGKQLLKIRVTDLNGNRISFLRATGRHFGKWISSLILLIGYFMNLWTEKKQTLHDMMAGCVVMRDE